MILKIFAYLFQETFVGTDNRPGLLDVGQGRFEVPLVLLHEEWNGDWRGAANAHLAVDQDFSAVVFGLLDEVVRAAEVFQLKIFLVFIEKTRSATEGQSS